MGALNLINREEKEPQVLVLSPTRELAEQSQKVASSLGGFMNIVVYCCIGG
jgi:ATP-dependent RNA helicase